MQRRHHTLLATNHDFLVNEIPVDETIDAIRNKHILNWHDFEQLKTLRHQGRKALARYTTKFVAYLNFCYIIRAYIDSKNLKSVFERYYFKNSHDLDLYQVI